MVHRTVYATGGRYGTRMMTAGEPMTLSGPAARAAIATGKATAKRPGGLVSESKTYRVGDGAREEMAPEKVAVDADERPALRATYEAKFGKKPFPGWGAATLREKIAAA